MTRRRVAGIVLAGGRSARFGTDKLAVEIDGRSLRSRAVDAVRPLVDEVVLAVGPTAAGSLPPEPSDLPAGIVVARDERAFEGPLAGLATALAATDADLAIVVAGDMPSMVPAVLARLLDALDDPAVDAVVLGPLDPTTDRGRPIPLGIRCEPARTAAADLLAAGERRLRALAQGLGAVSIPADEWRLDDPAGLTLRDIDVPADLDA